MELCCGGNTIAGGNIIFDDLTIAENNMFLTGMKSVTTIASFAKLDSMGSVPNCTYIKPTLYSYWEVGSIKLNFASIPFNLTAITPSLTNILPVLVQNKVSISNAQAMCFSATTTDSCSNSDEMQSPNEDNASLVQKNRSIKLKKLPHFFKDKNLRANVRLNNVSINTECSNQNLKI